MKPASIPENNSGSRQKVVKEWGWWYPIKRLSHDTSTVLIEVDHCDRGEKDQ